MKTRTLKKVRCSGSGQYSNYYRISKTRGIKLLHGGFNSIKEAKQSFDYKDATLECRYLRIAYKRISHIIPRCYGVKIIKEKHGYRIGIEMQHVGNKTLSDLSLLNLKKEDILHSLYDELLDNGIDHQDLHSNNVMFYKGNYYVIDFTPDWIDFS